MSAIRFEDISFVAQGPIDKSTGNCLKSIRQWCPGAEIVLSTWQGSDVSGLDYDTLVLSEDPGATEFTRYPSTLRLYSNGNRQIVSTAAGLRQVKRRYAAKIRTDIVLTGDNWLRLYQQFPERVPEWRMFQERVIAPNLYTRDPRRGVRKPFHPSDWFLFGLTEDLLLMWDIPLEPEPEGAHWFRTRPYPAGLKDCGDTRRYQAEQYVWKTLLSKFGHVDFDNFGDVGQDNIRLTLLTFANNLIVLDKEQFPFEMQKHGNPRRTWRYACISHREWLRLYRYYCRRERMAAVFSRITDLRHLLEGGYCRLPEPVRATVFKLAGGRNIPLKGSIG